jgi:hypothetical protein
VSQIAFPAGAKIRRVSWSLDRPAQVNRSAYTGARRVVANPWHGKWSARVELSTIVGEGNVRPWRAFLAKLKGQINTFGLTAAFAVAWFIYLDVSAIRCASPRSARTSPSPRPATATSTATRSPRSTAASAQHQRRHQQRKRLGHAHGRAVGHRHDRHGAARRHRQPRAVAGPDLPLWFAVYDAAGVTQQGAIVPYYTGYMSSIDSSQPETQTIRLSVENYLAAFNQASNRSYLNQKDYDSADVSAAATLAAANGARHGRRWRWRFQQRRRRCRSSPGAGGGNYGHLLVGAL